MKKYNESHGVDAGNISVADYGYYKKNGAKRQKITSIGHSKFGEIISLKNGTYQVEILVSETWNGDIKDSFKLVVTSGKVAIGDACYFWDHSQKGQDSWMKFLKETNYLDKSNNQFYSVNTGGDGAFDVTILFTPVKNETLKRYKRS